MPDTENANQKTNPTRLIFQGNIVVENEQQASEACEEIREFLKPMSKQTFLNCSVMKQIGPCCGDKKT